MQEVLDSFNQHHITEDGDELENNKNREGTS